MNVGDLLSCSVALHSCTFSASLSYIDSFLRLGSSSVVPFSVRCSGRRDLHDIVEHSSPKPGLLHLCQGQHQISPFLEFAILEEFRSDY